ncbi:MAG: ankyrin repeat domain-containing protein [bacterium]
MFFISVLITVICFFPAEPSLQAEPSPDKKLFYAVQAMNFKAAETAFKEGASPDAMDEDGWPVFITAVNTGSKKMAELFISKKVNPNLRDPGGKTALMHAVRNGDRNMAEYLIKYGADVSASDKHGKTVLIYAAINGDLSLVKKILAKGADRTAKDKDGKTALNHAAKLQKGPVVNLLGSIDARPRNLIRYVKEGKKRAVIDLLKKGVDVHTKDKNGKPLMLLAIENNHPFIVEKLIEHGVNPDQPYFKKGSLLDYAFHNENYAAAEMLLKHGASGNMDKRYKGKTPLMTAIEKKLLSLVSLILKQDFDPDKTDSYGNTALIHAIYQNNEFAVKKLLEKRADPLIRQVEGKNAIDIAREKNMKKIVKILEKAAEDSD